MKFEKFVTHAPRLLFKLGWLLAVLAFFSVLVPAFMGGNDEIIVASFLGGILNGLQLAVLPWIGAAALWRFDKYLESKA